MRQVVVVLGLLALLATLMAVAIAPPHFFIVAAGSNARSAILQVTDYPAHKAHVILGFALAKTDVVEGAAMMTITTRDGGQHHCRWGYFTHSELEPHFLKLSNCEDKWH